MKFRMTREYTPREKVLLAALGVVALMTILMQFVYLPMLQTRAELDEQIIELESANSVAASQAAREAEIDAALAEVMARLDQLSVALPKAHDIPQYLVMVQEAAQSAGIHVRQVQIGELEDKKDHGEIPIAMLASGDYHGVVRFLRLLENSPRYTTILNWQLGRSASVSWGGEVPAMPNGHGQTDVSLDAALQVMGQLTESPTSLSASQIDLSITAVIYVDSDALANPQPDSFPSDYPVGRSSPF